MFRYIPGNVDATAGATIAISLSLRLRAVRKVGISSFMVRAL
jgi:hypothetical protein